MCCTPILLYFVAKIVPTLTIDSCFRLALKFLWHVFMLLFLQAHLVYLLHQSISPKRMIFRNQDVGTKCGHCHSGHCFQVFSVDRARKFTCVYTDTHIYTFRCILYVLLRMYLYNHTLLRMIIKNSCGF